jgi:hypothetical protein
MVDLWYEGKLIRIGGEGARRGYRLPKPDEQKCTQLPTILPKRGEVKVEQVAARLRVEPRVVKEYVDQMPSKAKIITMDDVIKRVA